MAAGGMHRPDTTRVPLAERRRGEPAADLTNDPTDARAGDVGPGRTERPDDARPCWLDVGDDRVVARLHAWRRLEAAEEWEALVVAWVPQRAVRPRP